MCSWKILDRILWRRDKGWGAWRCTRPPESFPRTFSSRPASCNQGDTRMTCMAPRHTTSQNKVCGKQRLTCVTPALRRGAVHDSSRAKGNTAGFLTCDCRRKPWDLANRSAATPDKRCPRAPLRGPPASPRGPPTTCWGVLNLGVRSQVFKDSGFWVQGLGFRVQGLWF